MSSIGGDFLVNPFTTYDNDAHIHNKGATTQKDSSQENITASRGKIAIFCNEFKPKTKTPPKCCVNNHKVKIPSWNTQQVSRNLTDLTNYIITGPAPRTPVTNSSNLFLENPAKPISLSSEALSCSNSSNLFVLSNKANQLEHFKSFEEFVESFSSIFNTSQVKESIHSIESGCLSSQLLGWINFFKLESRSLTMKLTPKEKGKAAMIRSVKEITFSTEMGPLDYEPNRQ